MTPYDINKEDKILYSSKISPYMNIYNKYISNCKSKEEKLYVCLLDIQDFRYFNYIYGFEYGDKLLKDISIEIKEYIGENAFISGFIGDRLILVIPGSGIKDNNIEKAVNSLNIKLMVECKNTRINFRAGISVYPDHSRDTSEVLKYAEIALNYTKRNTNEKCKIYEPFMFREIVRKISIFPDIDHALDNKEFILLYQPLINISTMTVYGVEALLRWNVSGGTNTVM